MRRKPGSHLSKAGIKLARYAGSDLGPFSHVATSTIPRAIETAIAMGYEINETLELCGDLPNSVFDDVGWPRCFDSVSKSVKQSIILQNYSSTQAACWTSILRKIPDSTSALLISHGCILELGAVGCLPEANHSEWGDAIGYCEGVKLSFDTEFIDCELLRMPAKYRLLEN